MKSEWHPRWDRGNGHTAIWRAERITFAGGGPRSDGSSDRGLNRGYVAAAGRRRGKHQDTASQHG